MTLQRFQLREKVVGPHGPGEIVRVSLIGSRREYLVRYHDSRTFVADGSALKHTFRAMHPGMIGGNCANCWAPAGMHDDHMACREVDAPVLTDWERELSEQGRLRKSPSHAPIRLPGHDKVHALLDDIVDHGQ